MLSFLLNAFVYSAPTNVTLPQTNVTRVQETPMIVSFFGDTGFGRVSRSVLEIVKQSDFVVHLGDFDYGDDPAAFQGQLQQVLGSNYPYLAAVGNHDVIAWNGQNGYQSRLKAQWNRSKFSSNCIGDFGVKMSCKIGDIHVVVSGVGTLGTNHAQYIDQEFTNSQSKWKICAWHKNQRDYQVGGKTDEVGWEAYEACRKHGAIVMTGHEHSYSRSKVMSNFKDKIIDSESKTNLVIGKGRSFVVVSGLGGVGIRDYERNREKNKWWASTGASNDGITYGSVICEFYSSEAKCVLKQVNNKIWDSFTVTQQ